MICLVFILLHFGNRGPGFSSLQRPLGNLPRNGRVHSDRCPVSVAQPWWSSACQTRRKMSVTYSSCSLNMLPKSCFHLLAVRTMQRNCSRPSDVISHLCLYTTFFSISQSCLAKRKHRLRTFPDELLPPALEPFSAKGNWGGIWFFMSFPPPPHLWDLWKAAQSRIQAPPLTLAKMEVWAHASPWKLDPFAAGSGRLGCPEQ